MTDTDKIYSRPGIFRHLAIMLYDSLLLVSILLLASLFAVAFNSGEAIPENDPVFIAYLLAVSCFFYGWFWTHGGQTLGMRAWKVYIFGQQQEVISWKQAVIRFCIAIISWLPAGMGYWWQYLGKDKQSWPDYFSATRLHHNKQAKNKPLSRLS